MANDERRGRLSLLQLGALNIVTHPHTATGYRSLFERASRIGHYSRYWGNKAGELGDIVRTKLDGHDVLIGSVHLFTDFDTKGEWHDRNKKEGISAASMAADLDFLDRTKPEHEVLGFCFMIDKHKLIFEAGIAPASMARLIYGLFVDFAKEDERELIVTVEQEKDVLKEILSLAVLEELKIFVRPPNPDDGEEIEREFLRRLRDQRATSVTTTYTSEEGLKPSKETKAEASLALQNGHVEARGRATPEDKPKSYKTADHPVLHQHEFRTVTSRPDAFRQAVRDFIRRLLK